MKNSTTIALSILLCVPAAGADKLIARRYDSGFKLAHDSYNAMGVGSDGKVYYVLSTERHDIGAQMYSFNPKTGAIRHLGDLTEACGEKDRKTIVQGKSHVNFVERDGKLYFSTHAGFYTTTSGMEKMGVPPPGYRPYPGGHFLAYDMGSGRFQDLATTPDGGGIISMTMDTRRGRLYGLTWPAGNFLRFDLAKKELKNIGPVSGRGEAGEGAAFRSLCRSLVVNPEDGSVYFTTADGAILRYRYDKDAVETVAGEDMRKDYFGLYDPSSSGHMGYNWRQTFWHAGERVIYGVHGNSGYLFRFDPRRPRLEVLERLTSLPSRRSGMFDQFSFGYLGFALGPDGNTIHYLTGGPIYRDGKRVLGKASTLKGEAKGEENLHLVTYDIRAGQYTDHGPIFYDDGQWPTYVNSIALGQDGAVYTIARVALNGRSDLISFPGPLKRR